MKRIFWILIILLIGINLLQSSTIFCSQNVELKLAQIIEHTEKSNIKNINLQNITQFLKASNDKYQTDFSTDSFYKFDKQDKIPDIIINTNIFHYNLVFLLLKTLIITALGIIIIKKIQSTADNIDFKPSEFLLISFLAIYQPLSIYSLNLQEMKFLHGMLTVLVIYLYFLLSYIVFKLLIKNRIYCIITAILWTSLSLNFFSLLYTMKNYINCLAVIFIILYLIYSIDTNIIKRITKIFSVTLIMFVIINFITSIIPIINYNLQKDSLEKQTDIISKSSNRNRDIYIIILDMYSGQDILKQKFDFDNHEFINELKKEGFYVFDHMYSNYNYTYASIPTILNLEYLENTDAKTGSMGLGNAILFKIAKNNNYHTVLKKTNFFNVKSEYIDIVEELKNQGLLDLYNILFVNSFYKEPIINLFRKFINIKDVFYTGKLKEKNFIVIHVMAPHFPFLYDENGKEIKGADINNKEKSYLPYLKYTNKITLNYIKSIKQIHSKPPVIIITGDHGIRDKDNIESYFSTFTAYYNPELKYDHIKNSKSLINFFINFTNYEFNLKLRNKIDKQLNLNMNRNIEDNSVIKEIKEAKDVTSILKYNKK